MMTGADWVGAVALAALVGSAVALAVHEALAWSARRDRDLITLRLMARGVHPSLARHDAVVATRGRRLSVFAGRSAR